MIYTQIRPLDQPGVALPRLSGPPMGAGKGLGATDATPAPLEVKGARWKAGYFFPGIDGHKRPARRGRCRLRRRVVHPRRGPTHRRFRLVYLDGTPFVCSLVKV